MMNTSKFQYPASMLIILAASLLCLLALDFVGYKAIALVLLMVVSLLAMLFDIWPVLMASVLSALIWNFFFIPPRFTFHIRETDDILMFLMYFMVALVNAVLTYKIKVQERKARDKEEREKAIHLYNTLFNSLSHELKTPISTILTAAETLKENNAPLSAHLKATLIAEIEIAGTRLNRQVENLLHMSRLESGMLKVKRDWCDISELIYTILQKVGPDVQNRISYEPDQNLPLFKLDAGLIEHVIFNIVHNAIQYTPPDTLIRISVLSKDEKCVITISDNGPGIPEKDLSHLFEKFYRLSELKTGGTGLGLSIAKGVIEAHDGTITVENRKEGGAQFLMEIPAETSFLTYIKNE